MTDTRGNENVDNSSSYKKLDSDRKGLFPRYGALYDGCQYPLPQYKGATEAGTFPECYRNAYVAI